MALEVVFRNATSEFLTATNEQLVSFRLIKQADSNADGVIGNITASYVEIELETTVLPTSRQHIQEQLSNDFEVEIYENGLTKGIFYSDGVDSPFSSSKQTIDIYATDRLQPILAQDIGIIDMKKDVTAHDLLYEILTKCGVTRADVEIEMTIANHSIDTTTIKGSTIADILNELCIVLDCYLFVEATNKIVIKNRQRNNSTVKTDKKIDDSTNLFEISYGSDRKSRNNVLKIAFNRQRTDKLSNVLSLTDRFKVGKSELKGNKVDGKLFAIGYVRSHDANVRITDVAFTQTKVDLIVENKSTEEIETTIDVFGVAVEFAESELVEKDETSIKKYGENALTVSTSLTANEVILNGIKDTLWGRLRLPIQSVSTTIYSQTMEYELLDTVAVNSQIAEVDRTMYVHSLDYSYSGGSYNVKVDLK